MCQALSDTKVNKIVLAFKELMAYWSGEKKERHRKYKARVLIESFF